MLIAAASSFHGTCAPPNPHKRKQSGAPLYPGASSNRVPTTLSPNDQAVHHYLLTQVQFVGVRLKGRRLPPCAGVIPVVSDGFIFKNMVLINDKKFACETCIKGHRSSACNHTSRPLFEIKKKGRPVTQCNHCRELRKTKQVHGKCLCGTKEPQVDVTMSDPRTSQPKKNAGMLSNAASPEGMLNGRADSDSYNLNEAAPHPMPCHCSEGGPCKCSTVRGPRRSKPKTGADIPPAVEATASRFPQSDMFYGTSSASEAYHFQTVAGIEPLYPPGLASSFNSPTESGGSSPDLHFPTEFPPFGSFEGGSCSCEENCQCTACLNRRISEGLHQSPKACATSCSTCFDCAMAAAWESSKTVMAPPSMVVGQPTTGPLGALNPMPYLNVGDAGNMAWMPDFSSSTSGNRCGTGCQCGGNCRCTDGCCGCCFGRECELHQHEKCSGDLCDSTRSNRFATSGERGTTSQPSEGSAPLLRESGGSFDYSMGSGSSLTDGRGHHPYSPQPLSTGRVRVSEPHDVSKGGHPTHRILPPQSRPSSTAKLQKSFIRPILPKFSGIPQPMHKRSSLTSDQDSMRTFTSPESSHTSNFESFEFSPFPHHARFRL